MSPRVGHLRCAGTGQDSTLHRQHCNRPQAWACHLANMETWQGAGCRLWHGIHLPCARAQVITLQPVFWSSIHSIQSTYIHPAVQAGASGMVINTMGFIDGAGYDLLLHSIQALKADVVLVLGQDRLFSQLQSALRVSHSGQGL